MPLRLVEKPQQEATEKASVTIRVAKMVCDAAQEVIAAYVELATIINFVRTELYLQC